jgi:HTH-type transcriptional regulator/antitoxin HipB
MGATGFDAGRLLMRARREADVSQRDLAERAGLARSTVAGLEAGTRSVRLEVFVRLLAAAGARLAVLGPDGEELVPFAEDTVRDNAGRRFPAHLDVRPPDDVPEERICSPRYDRAEAKGWYHHRERRQEARAGGEAPASHPGTAELEYRRLERLHGRSPWWPRREAEIRRRLGLTGEDDVAD